MSAVVTCTHDAVLSGAVISIEGAAVHGSVSQRHYPGLPRSGYGPVGSGQVINEPVVLCLQSANHQSAQTSAGVYSLFQHPNGTEIWSTDSLHKHREPMCYNIKRTEYCAYSNDNITFRSKPNRKQSMKVSDVRRKIFWKKTKLSLEQNCLIGTFGGF